MATDNFFTTLQNYVKCCFWCRSGSCFFADKRGGLGTGDDSPYSIDNFSNSDTPMTKSSSESSIDSTYTRPKFRPYIGIIPANYYTE